MFIAGHNFSFFFHAVIMRLSSLVLSRSFSRLSVLRILFACDDDEEDEDVGGAVGEATGFDVCPAVALVAQAEDYGSVLLHRRKEREREE